MELIYLNQRGSRTPPNFTEIIHDVRSRMNLDHAAYAAYLPGSDKAFVYSTYPDAWVREFAEKQYHAISPTITMARDMVSPLDWATLRGNPLYEQLRRDAVHHDMPVNGITIPVRGPAQDLGIMALSKHCTDTEWSRIIAKNTGEFMLIAAQFHDSFMRHSFNSEAALDDHPPALNDLEKRALQFLSEGQDIAEIAASIGLSIRSCTAVLYLVRLKLSAITDEHAVLRAQVLGLLPADPKDA